MLLLIRSGTGGLEDFKAALKDDQAAYGYLRMTVGNDELSKRSKFVFVTWCGPQVKVMRKAKLSVHVAAVKNVIKSFAVEVAATSKNVRLFLKRLLTFDLGSFGKGTDVAA